VIFDAQVDGHDVRVEVQRRDGRYVVTLDGEAAEVDLLAAGVGFVSAIIEGASYEAGLERHKDGYRVHLDGDVLDVALADAARGAAPAPRVASGPTQVTAPMPGKIVRVLVEPGVQVEAGRGLIVMEAMKMENELRAPRAGRVREIIARDGQAVEAGALLALLD